VYTWIGKYLWSLIATVFGKQERLLKVRPLGAVDTSFGWGKGGNITSVGWQVTLCDPIWHVSSRSGVATLRTAIHLLLTYLLTYRKRSSIKNGYLLQDLLNAIQEYLCDISRGFNWLGASRGPLAITELLVRLGKHLNDDNHFGIRFAIAAGKFAEKNFWRELAKIGTSHLYSVHRYFTMDRRIARLMPWWARYRVIVFFTVLVKRTVTPATVSSSTCGSDLCIVQWYQWRSLGFCLDSDKARWRPTSDGRTGNSRW